MELVTREQLEEVEEKLQPNDRSEIAKRLNINRGIVSQVIRYKFTHSKYAEKIYIEAGKIFCERDLKPKT